MSGYLANAQCYPTKWEAAQVFVSTAPVTVRSVSGNDALCRVIVGGEVGNDEHVEITHLCEISEDGGTTALVTASVPYAGVPCPDPTTEDALSAVGITGPYTALAFTFGLSAVLTLWALGYAINAAKTVIRKI